MPSKPFWEIPLKYPSKKLLSEHMRQLVKVQVWQLTKFDTKPASDLESNYWYPTFRAGLCATLIFGDILRPSMWGHIEPVGTESVSDRASSMIEPVRLY